MYSTTEQRNPETLKIDQLDTLDVLSLINQQDQSVPYAINQPELLEQMSKIVVEMTTTFKNGRRIFYIGAGTSGRLGVLDAVEIVPTYGVSPDRFVPLMAGGQQAMYEAVEGAEDNADLAVQDLKNQHFQPGDFLIGIAASGRTPYVIGGLDYAHSLGVKTASIACNKDALISQHADLPLEIIVGPEVVTGSTRMKAGTAQKLVLNMLSTTTMIKCGKVYGNLMVDLKPTNQKLKIRAKSIVQEATGTTAAVAEKAYFEAHESAKVAIVMLSATVDYQSAVTALINNDDRVALAIAALLKK